MPVKAESSTTVGPTSHGTIQALINTAGSRTTIFLKKGVYEEETLLISKAISIVGEDANGTIINLHPQLVQAGYHLSGNGGIAPDYEYEPGLRITANGAKLSGFTINSCSYLSIEGTQNQITNNILIAPLFLESSSNNVSMNVVTQGISCFGGVNNTISANKVSECPILVNVGSSSNIICNNTITDVTGPGVCLNRDGNIVFNNTMQNCTYGVSILESSSNNIYENRIINNIEGFQLYSQGNNNAFHDNYVANNQYGVLLSTSYSFPPGKNNTVYHNNFINNTEQINRGAYPNNTLAYTPPTGDYDNGKEGNYWNDYKGTDVDNDGIGDSPYFVDAIRKDNYPLMYPWGKPIVSIFGLTNTTHSGLIPLNFIIDKPVRLMGYSLDGQENVTIIGNTTLTGLTSGLHNVTIYATDRLENTGASETVTFSISESESIGLESLQVNSVEIAVAVSTIVIIVCLLVYLRKRKHQLPESAPKTQSKL